jgi:hypothetical protein
MFTATIKRLQEGLLVRQCKTSTKPAQERHVSIQGEQLLLPAVLTKLLMPLQARPLSEPTLPASCQCSSTITA